MNKFKFYTIFTIIFVAGFFMFEASRFSYPGELFFSFLPYISIGSFLLFTACLIFLIYRLFLQLRPTDNGSKNNLFLLNIILIMSLCLVYPLQFISFYNSKTSNYESENLDQHLKVMSTNILASNTNYEGIKETILDQNPDVLILIELTQSQENELIDVLDQYEYSSKRRMGFGQTVIFSKYEIENSEIVSIRSNKSSFLHSVIKAHGKNYNFVAVHTPSPISQPFFKARNEFLKELASYLNEEDFQNLVMAGDFNVSPWSKSYERFMNNSPEILNVTSSKPSFTWGRFLGFAMVHIDHIFISKDLKFSNYKVVSMPGSDHNAVITDIF